MMTLLTDFIVAMTVSSAVLWLAAWVFQRINPRAEQWSSLWALALGLSVLIPALGLATRWLPDWAALPSVEAFVGHGLRPPLAAPRLGDPVEALSLSALPWHGIMLAAVILYLVGLVVRALILILGRLSLRRLIRAAEPFGAAKAIPVILSNNTRSAFAWTPLARPAKSRIVIPALYAQQMTDEQIADIITHEREHIARRDDELGLILRSLLCLCWVSPFAHSLFARWSQAAEIHCDMAVTNGRAPQMRKAYAETLLQALHIVAGRVRQYPAAAFSTPSLWKKDLRNEKMRLMHIVTGTRPSFKRGRDRICLAMTATCLTLAGTLGVAATAQADASKAQTSNSVTSAIVAGRLTSTYGPAEDPFNKGAMRDHYGIDIAAPLGTPIYAPASGTIQAATDLYQGKPNYGTVVVLQTEGGVTTLFSHLDSYTVTPGQRVTKGQQIATVGSSGKSTGPHVHIETFKADIRVDPMTVWDLAVD